MNLDITGLPPEGVEVDPIPPIVHDLLRALYRSDDPLVALLVLHNGMHRLEEYQRDLVRKARAAGHSWAEIAAPMGVTPQALSKRYGKGRL
jgi:DNA-directed RNA polymerase specialized sigma24 family protein